MKEICLVNKRIEIFFDVDNNINKCWCIGLRDRKYLTGLSLLRYDSNKQQKAATSTQFRSRPLKHNTDKLTKQIEH